MQDSRARGIYTYMTRIRFPAALIVALSTADAASAPQTADETKSILVTGTEEAALGQPRVRVQLRQGDRILTGDAPLLPENLDDLGSGRREAFITAYLDTGASGCVLSKATARRFGVEHERDAAFHEIGLHGESVVDISVALDVFAAIAEADKKQQAAEALTRMLKGARFQISRETPPALLQLMGELNVIGMPAIRTAVIEIDPAPMRGEQGAEALMTEGPRVTLHDRKARLPQGGLVIDMEPIDFSRRRHPENRGPLPTLASNPIVPAVETSAGAAKFTCDWLLDTGAAASIISTRHAQALGLLNPDGTPARPADFTLPLGGIAGTAKATPGYIIDGLRIKLRGTGRNARTLEFRRVHVVIRDITATLDSGRSITLDGVLGMNLLLPSASGVSDGEPDVIGEGPFERVWIDGPRNALHLELRGGRTR
jgi:hypothetical protein